MWFSSFPACYNDIDFGRSIAGNTAYLWAWCQVLETKGGIRGMRDQAVDILWRLHFSRVLH